MRATGGGHLRHQPSRPESAPSRTSLSPDRFGKQKGWSKGQPDSVCGWTPHCSCLFCRFNHSFVPTRLLSAGVRGKYQHSSPPTSPPGTLPKVAGVSPKGPGVGLVIQGLLLWGSQPPTVWVDRAPAMSTFTSTSRRQQPNCRCIQVEFEVEDQNDLFLPAASFADCVNTPLVPYRSDNVNDVDDLGTFPVVASSPHLPNSLLVTWQSDHYDNADDSITFHVASSPRATGTVNGESDRIQLKSRQLDSESPN